MESNLVERAAQSVVLFTVKVHGIGGQRKNAKASMDVAAEAGAAADRTAVVVQMLDKERLDPVRKAAQAVRSVLPRFGVPYGVLSGQFAVPAVRVVEAQAELKQAIAVYEDAAFTHVLSVYDDIRREAEAALGDLFDEEKFPSMLQMQHAFRVEYSVVPMPTPHKLAVVSTEVADTLAADMERSAKAGFVDAVKRGLNALQDELNRFVQMGEHGRVFESRFAALESKLNTLSPLADVLDEESVSELLRESRALLERSGGADSMRGKSNEGHRKSISRQAKIIRNSVEAATKSLGGLL